MSFIQGIGEISFSTDKGITYKKLGDTPVEIIVTPKNKTGIEYNIHCDMAISSDITYMSRKFEQLINPVGSKGISKKRYKKYLHLSKYAKKKRIRNKAKKIIYNSYMRWGK